MALELAWPATGPGAWEHMPEDDIEAARAGPWVLLLAGFGR